MSWRHAGAPLAHRRCTADPETGTLLCVASKASLAPVLCPNVLSSASTLLFLRAVCLLNFFPPHPQMVWLDVEIKGKPVGRIEMVLFSHISPRAAENMR